MLETARVTPSAVAGRQIELCMIGDSITWFGWGDYFRKYLLEGIPELAFKGHRTAMLGYSHAGEGGNHTHDVLRRLHDPIRVPDSRYYHLLIGINDCASSSCCEGVPVVARWTTARIMLILKKLLARPRTEKIFLGTILPCYPEVEDPDEETLRLYERRDASGATVNRLLRQLIPARFGDRVVLIEYEKPLRAREDWRQIIRLHPLEAGYRVIGAIAAAAMRPEMVPENRPLTEFGVEVTNLWDPETALSQVLPPAWYTISCRADAPVDGQIAFVLRSRSGVEYRFPFRLEFRAAARPGERVWMSFFTGPASTDYTPAALEIVDPVGGFSEIMIEKMRPCGIGSRYGVGTFVDTETPVSLGEQLVFPV